MGTFLLITWGVPFAYLAVVCACATRVSLPRAAITIVSALFIGLGVALGVGGASIRAAVVPGGYISMRGIDVFTDLFSSAWTFGGGFTICGLIMFLSRKK